MGETIKHLPVKLIIGFIYKDASIFQKAKALLEKKFGPPDFESDKIPFSHTGYYEPEMGKSLARSFIGFKKLIAPQRLSRIKLLTNKIENKFSKRGLRQVNIDPGYLELSKLILASTKDYFHRIYLDKGIFAELTLIYRGQTFQPLEWTYPDYGSGEYITIFNRMRAIYAKQIKTI